MGVEFEAPSGAFATVWLRYRPALDEVVGVVEPLATSPAERRVLHYSRTGITNSRERTVHGDAWFRWHDVEFARDTDEPVHASVDDLRSASEPDPEAHSYRRLAEFVIPHLSHRDDEFWVTAHLPHFGRLLAAALAGQIDPGPSIVTGSPDADHLLATVERSLEVTLTDLLPVPEQRRRTHVAASERREEMAAVLVEMRTALEHVDTARPEAAVRLELLIDAVRSLHHMLTTKKVISPAACDATRELVRGGLPFTVTEREALREALMAAREPRLWPTALDGFRRVTTSLGGAPHAR